MKVVRIPAKRAISFEVSAGTEFTVINPKGTQVADLTALTRDSEITFSQAHTRDFVGKTRVTVDDSLYARDGTPMISIIDDNCGVHDLLYAPCTGWLLTPPEFFPQPTGCQEHLLAALEANGVAVPDTIDTVNLFQEVAVTDEAQLTVRPSPAEAGDEVRFAAESDVIVAISACAALNPTSKINGETVTPIDVRVPDTTTVCEPVPETDP